MTPQEILSIERDIVAALKGVFDPEIPINVYDLGLIYEIDFEPGGTADAPAGTAHIQMTLTAPNCPVADSLVEDVQRAVAGVEGVSGVDLKLTFDPPWDKSMLTDEAKLELGFL
ncbi:MAG: iron-sulfur cluster assembly protein [Alistipes sp.]|jgi:FeS assembly SUF system protein|nr:iron-sulfur cluster assembly protein [Alistipes sp.]